MSARNHTWSKAKTAIHFPLDAGGWLGRSKLTGNQMEYGRQRICAICKGSIDRDDSHFEDGRARVFYCFDCGRRRVPGATDRESSLISHVLLALLLTLVLAIAALSAF